MAMMSLRQQRNLLLLLLLATIGLLPTIPLFQQRSSFIQEPPPGPVAPAVSHPARTPDKGAELPRAEEGRQYYKPHLLAVDLLEADPDDVPPLVRAWRHAKLDFHDIPYLSSSSGVWGPYLIFVGR
jgi:hypothetical protein